MSGLIANDIKISLGRKSIEFDALWESSFTDSASKGLPDAEIVGFDSRCTNIKQILDVTNKPMIVDGDTGMDPSNFEYMVKTLESIGVSAVIIEDKVFPKRNSLEDGSQQLLEDPNVFISKLQRGKNICQTSDFMIIARLESLIAGTGMDDAVYRAGKYIKSGVDGIMIHSKQESPDEIIEFCHRYRELCDELSSSIPLVCVPTTYNTVTEEELKDLGVNVVIYANHLMRASYKSMTDVAKTILMKGRSLEVDPFCATTKEIFQHVGFLDIKEKDQLYAKKSETVIIPAAGSDPEFDVPKAALKISGIPLLELQKKTLHSLGISDINVIRGYGGDSIQVKDIRYYENDRFGDTGILESLLKAKDKMEDGFIYLNSDILFTENIIRNLMNTWGDIILVVDNSYTYHKHQVDKELDLIISRNRSGTEPHFKDLHINFGEIVRIGKKINKMEADYEFTGIAKFSEKGAAILIKVYNDLKGKIRGAFHEAEHFEKASFTDIIQELISMGIKVEFMNVYKGWMEIHDRKDLKLAQELL
jgi:phosphoenolpyruvate phosphomutase